MARVNPRRRFALAGIVVAVAVLCAACAPSQGTEEEHVSQVGEAVTAADQRVVSVSADKSVDGLSWGWTLDIVLSGSEPVTSDELGNVLKAARHAGDLDPGHVDVFATDEGGSSFDLTTAADGLGLRYSKVGAGISVPREMLDDTLGTGE